MSWNSKFLYSYIACCWLGRVTQPCMTWHLLSSSKDNPPCSELRGSLLCFQEPTIASYAEPHKSSPHTPYFLIIQKHVFLLHLDHWCYVFLKVSGERVFFLCISNILHANCVLLPCHTRFDEPDNILWSSMRGKLCLSPSERNTGKEGMRDRRWPEGEKVKGEWKKLLCEQLHDLCRSRFIY
jgi:hypothetical protein